jgi:carbonic anhydrase
MKKSLKNKLSLALALAASLTLAPMGRAADHGHGGHADGGAASPAQTVKAVIDGNDRFLHQHDSHAFDAYQEGQAPALTIIACSDSRVHTDLFGIDPKNNIFVIRNIGNQLATAQGSVDYGIHHLPTRILLVLGHSSCGAIKAAMGDYAAESAGIREELDSLRPVIATDKGQGSFKERWARNIEINVDYQVREALALYDDKVKSGEMVVMGAVYDFNDVYGKGRGSLLVTNVNGESDPEKIAQMPALKELSLSQVAEHVASLAPSAEFAPARSH